MRKGFYRQFAIDSIKKNRQSYFPYILTCIGMTMVYYILSALSMNESIKSLRGAAAIASTMSLGSAVVAIFSVIFLFYTNSFIMKQRRREFGIYYVLGMEKKHICRIMADETLISGAISMLVGLVFGILFNWAAFLLLIRLLGQSGTLTFQFSFPAMIRTIILFAVIYLLIYLNSVRQIHSAVAVELLKSENAGEKEPKSKWILALLGVICLSVSYYIAVTIKNPISALSLFFGAVILVIIGTYCLFTAGSIVLLKLLRKNKKYYYRTNHFISISGMIYRMKQNAASLASICVLSTMVLVMLSTTLSLYIGSEDILAQRFPREISITTYLDPENMTEEAINQTKDVMNEVLSERGMTSDDELQLTSLSVALRQEGSSFTMGRADDMTVLSDPFFCMCAVMPLSDYNRISGENETLNADEVLLYDSAEAYNEETVVFNDLISYQVKKQLSDFPEKTCTGMGGMGVRSILLVTADMSEVTRLYTLQAEIYGEAKSPVQTWYGTDITDTSAEQEIEADFTAALEARQQAAPDESRVSTAFKELDRGTFFYPFAGLLFIGIFLSMAFIMAMVLTIYYKQISEGLQDCRRFDIMRRVGLNDREIRKSIHSQVLTVFFLPLVCAGLHCAFAYPMIEKILVLLSLYNTKLFTCCMLGAFVIFALVYCGVYVATSHVYYKIVRAAK